MRESFRRFHPAVNFIYYIAVIGFGMFLLHPVFLTISWISAFLYAFYLNRRKALKFTFFFVLPMMLLTAVLNPLFNHGGVTILFYFKNGNPVTLEALLYGLVMAALFGTTLLWFSSFNQVMTMDRLTAVFGRFLPSLSLVISMSLRFVPRYKERIKDMSNAQLGIGKDVRQGSLFTRVKNGLSMLSAMTTWALENGIETAESMRARGYGLSGRTSYQNLRFKKRDALAILTILLLAAVIIWGQGAFTSTVFFPYVSIAKITPMSLIIYLLYCLLCNFPLIYSLKEELVWHCLKSKI